MFELGSLQHCNTVAILFSHIQSVNEKKTELTKTKLTIRFAVLRMVMAFVHLVSLS